MLERFAENIWSTVQIMFLTWSLLVAIDETCGTYFQSLCIRVHSHSRALNFLFYLQSKILCKLYDWLNTSDFYQSQSILFKNMQKVHVSYWTEWVFDCDWLFLHSNCFFLRQSVLKWNVFQTFEHAQTSSCTLQSQANDAIVRVIKPTREQGQALETLSVALERRCSKVLTEHSVEKTI